MASKQPLGNMVIELDLNSSAFGKGLQGAKKAVTSSMKAMRAEMKIMDASGNKMGVLESKRKGLSRTLEAQREEIKRLEQAYKESFDSEGNATKATGVYANKLNDARGKAASLEKQIGQTDEAIKKLAKQKAIDASPFTKLGKQLDEVGTKMKSVGDKMTGIGKSMSMKVTAPIVAGFTASVKSAVDYEQALAGVQKTTDLSKKEMAKMSKAITDMSNSMPFAATEVAGVAEAAGQLGVKKKDITGFTKTMLNMSVATDMTSDEAATAFAKFANASGMPMENVDRLGASVVALGNNTATTESELVEMGQRLAGAGAQAGFSADQIMGISAAMSSVGINAEAGGSAMTQIFNKMTKAAANGGDELDSFAKTSGMSAEDFANTWENNPTKALQAFVTGLSNTKGGAAGVVKALDDVGIKGIREADTIRRLANNHSVLDKALETSAKGWKDNTALSKEAEVRYETLGSKLKVLKNNLVNLGREIGATIAPYVETLTDKLTSLIKKFQGMSLHNKQMIVIFGLIAAAIGPLLIVIGQIGIGIGTLAKGFGKINKGLGILSGSIKNAGGLLAWLKAGFGAINWPITLTIAAIVGVTAGLVALYRKSETFRDIVNGAVEAVKNKFLQFKEVVSSLFSLFTGGINFSQAKEQLNSVVSEKTVARFQAVHDVIGKIGAAFQALFTVIQGGDTGALHNLFGDTFSDQTIQRIADVGKVIRNFIDTAKQKFAEFGSAISQAFQGNLEPLLNIIETLIPKIVMMLIGGIPSLIYTGVTLISKLADGMGMSVPELLEKVTEVITNMLTKFAEMLPSIMEQGTQIVMNLIMGIMSFIPQLIEMSSTVITTIVDGLTIALPAILYAGISILSSLITGILNALPQIIDTAVKLIDTLVTGLVSVLPKIISAGIKILNALISGIISILPKLVTVAVRLITKVATTLINNLPKIISAGVKILLALVQGLIKVLPSLIKAGLTLIISLAAALIENLPKIISAGIKVLKALIKGLIQTIPVLVKALPQIFKAITGAFAKVNWAKLGKNVISGIIKGLGSMIGELKDSVFEIAGSIGGWFKKKLKIHSPSRVMADIAQWVPKGIAQGISDNQNIVEQAMTGLTDGMQQSVQPQEITADVKTDVNADPQQVPAVNSEEFVDNVDQPLKDNSAQMNLFGVDWLNNLLLGFQTTEPAVNNETTQLVNTTNQAIKNNNAPMFLQGKVWYQQLLKGLESLYGALINQIKKLISQINQLIRNNNKPMYNHGRAWLQNLYNGFNSLYKSFINLVHKLCSAAVNLLRGKYSAFYNAGKHLMNGLKSGINSAGSSLQSIMNGIANKMVGGIGKGVNGVRAGVNHILKEVDSKKRIGEWKVPHYRKGTSGHPEDGPAMVNDQSGPLSKRRELIQNPDGSMWMAKARNSMVYLQKGAKVFNASMTNRFKKNRHIPHYAKGTENDDIYDLIDDKKKFSTYIRSKIDLKKVNGPWKDMTSSASKIMMNEAYKMVQDEAGEMMGSFDGKIWHGGPAAANGVYAYLIKVAQKVMKKFPGMSFTSGYRPGDPYHHGKRQAIDIAYPNSMNGSKKYLGPANYAYEHFKKQVAYVIALNKVKDRTGYSGTGKHDSWKVFPDGGHMNHMHLSGMFGPGDVGKGSGKGPKASGGHKNWMRLAGFKPSEYSAINWIVNHESGWNVRATNPSSGAYGLPQSLPGSKMASAGSDWRTNPVTQLRWMRKYVNSRYGGANGAIRFWKSHNWYENGGLITQPGFFAGEHFKPEMMLPLTDKARSLQLMSKAQRIMGVSNKTDTIQVDGNNNDETNEKLDTLIEIMSDFGEDLRNLKVILDGKQLATEVTNQQNRSTMLRKRAGGVRT